ncbi:MAG TPA: ATP-dependent sacrificial sulfur transferase LarE [Polyangiaceae bacterium]|nr:ATP-dependent sacrificial sulfur transferase LarE [Polyangiaceae bacterium]
MTTAVVPTSSSLDEKLLELHHWFEALGSVLVCYSGGVDSAFVLAAAARALGPRAIGMTAVSASLAPGELEEAKRVAAALGAEHRVVESFEVDDPSYRKNAPDRCFHCKSELYAISERKRAQWGIEHVVNGTNVEDLGDYRPGLDAARKAGVKSPLVELGFTKALVREGAARFGVEVWDKPASACLSSRIPFGTEVTPARLRQIGALESRLRALGFRQLRVRYHLVAPDSEHAIARIELAAGDIATACGGDMRERIVLAGREEGFLYVTIDLAGYRMGSHNEALGKRALPVVS